MALDDRTSRSTAGASRRARDTGLLSEPPEAPPGPSLEEQRIVERARGGDREAFRELVEVFQDRVFRMVRRMVKCDRDSAADFTQEVFLRVYRGLPSFDGRSRFTTWLYKIVQNLAISDYRHRRAQKRGKWTFSLDAPLTAGGGGGGEGDDLTLEPEATDASPEDQAYHREIALQVQRAVQNLPEEFRQAVLLRDLQGLSYEEIGEMLGVPAGTVRSRIHRGRLILQEKLRELRP